MPELINPRIRNLGVELRYLASQRVAMSRGEVVNQTAKYGLEFIGGGAECIVVKEKTNLTSNDSIFNKLINRIFLGTSNGSEELVVGIGYGILKEPKQVKREFYTHRVFATLFPHNFPRFVASHASFSQEQPHVSFRSFLLSNGNKEGKSYKKLDRNSLYPFYEVIQFLRNSHIPVQFDLSGFNFCLGNDGGTYYMDTIIEMFSVYKFTDDEKNVVINWMGEKGYSENDIKIVNKSFERIKALVNPIEVE